MLGGDLFYRALSSTFRDLKEHRKAVLEAIDRCDIYPRGMEAFGAQPKTPVKASLEEVRKADIFVGIYAHRYGSIPERYESSLIELELNCAEENGIPILAFIVDSSHTWPSELKDTGEKKKKLQELKKRIDASYTRDNFTTPDDLAIKVISSIGRHLKELLDKTRKSHQPSTLKPIVDISKAFKRKDDLFQPYMNEYFRPDFLMHFQKSRKEKFFVMKRLHKEFLDTFQKSCSMDVKPSIDIIPDDMLPSVLARCIGIMGTTYVRATDNIKDNEISITFTLNTDSLRNSREENESFLAWMDEFTEYQRKNYDDALLNLHEKMQNMERNDIFEKLRALSLNPIEGLARINKLLELKIKFIDLRKDAYREYPALWWAFISSMMIDSIPETKDPPSDFLKWVIRQMKKQSELGVL